MKCVNCGTTNVNKMLVSFIAEFENGEQYMDITTLPKFLYYLEFPEKRDELNLKEKKKFPYKIINVRTYCCDNCKGIENSKKKIEGKRGDAGLRIPSRLYGF